jgi:ABC-2 type transport system permease protein
VRRAVRAEWVKALSDPATWWVLAALAALTMAAGLAGVAAARCPAAGCGQDPARVSLTGFYLCQPVAAVAGVLAIGGEYGTGMMRVSLTAVPRRGRLLAAKTVVLACAAGARLARWLRVPPWRGLSRGYS